MPTLVREPIDFAAEQLMHLKWAARHLALARIDIDEQGHYAGLNSSYKD